MEGTRTENTIPLFFINESGAVGDRMPLAFWNSPTEDIYTDADGTPIAHPRPDED